MYGISDRLRLRIRSRTTSPSSQGYDRPRRECERIYDLPFQSISRHKPNTAYIRKADIMVRTEEDSHEPNQRLQVVRRVHLLPTRATRLQGSPRRATQLGALSRTVSDARRHRLRENRTGLSRQGGASRQLSAGGRHRARSRTLKRARGNLLAPHERVVMGATRDRRLPADA